MRVRKDEFGHSAIERLERWISTHSEIPGFRHRANKAAICREIGIARSTANANPRIRALFVTLDENILESQHTALPHTVGRKNTVLEDTNPPALERRRQTEAECQSLAIEHLLQTGRIVR